jgi:prepilin signal peptidase PulO-like enzyme (type II secretory pathway)
MMTGIQSVNNILSAYRILTLAILLLFAIYDYRHHKVRNCALLAFLPWCLLYIPIAITVLPSTSVMQILLHCILGSMSGFLLLLSISSATNGGIGGGDIKLVALIGIFLGASCLMAVLTAACLLALFHLGIQAFLKKRRVHHIPFVPYIFTGYLLITVLQLFVY